MSPAPVLARPERSFWRRNAAGFALLIPALLLALGTTGMTYMTLYRPFEMTRAHSSGDDGWAHLDVRLEPNGVAVHREVSARITSLEIDPGAGPQGWDAVSMILDFSAPPDSPVSVCSMRVVGDDGAEYQVDAVLPAVGADAQGTEDPQRLTGGDCVPEESPGPGYGIGDTEVRPDPDAPAERPERWRREVQVALPPGVRVERLKIGWEPPDYLELEPPA